MSSAGYEGPSTPFSELKKPAPGDSGDAVGDRPPPPSLEDCPVTPLGIDGHDFWYFNPVGQLVLLAGAAHHRRGVRSLFAGDLTWLKRHFPAYDQNGTPKPGSWSDDTAAGWLIDQCRRLGIFDANCAIRGPGVWRRGSAELIVHSGDVLLLPQGAEILPAGQKINGVLYPAAPPLARPALRPATAEDGVIVLKAIRLWTFRDRVDPKQSSIDPVSSELLLGFIGSGMLGGAPDWRPHMLVKAQHGGGKTWLAELVHALLGAGAHPMQNNYTEAGLRQALTREARVLVLDEAESTGADSRVRAVIEMLRHMSGGQGSRAVRGTTGGKALGYHVTGCAYLSAILPPTLEPQDRSRIMTLDLRPIPSDVDAGENRERAQAATVWAQERSAALRARAVLNWALFCDCFGAYHAGFLARGCTMRQADQLATLLAGRDLLLQETAPDRDSAEAEIRRFAHLIETMQQDDAEGEGEQCLNHLYSFPTDHWRSGDRRTVGELVQSVCEGGGTSYDDGKALGRIGLRVDKADHPGQFWLLVANRHVGLDRIFAGTRWERGAWSTALGYLHNVKHGETSTHFAGAASRFLMLPTPWLPVPERPTEDEERRREQDRQLAEGEK